MEIKKLKLKPHYIVAIILGLAIAPILFNWFINLPIIRLSPNEYANAYLSPYSISEKYERLFNERTFCEDVINNKSDLFYERNIGFLISQILYGPFRRTYCTDQFYEKLPQVVFQQIMDDNLSEWTVGGINCEVRMNGTSMETFKIAYHYQRPYMYHDERRCLLRDIEYWNYLDWINIHDYLPNWSSCNNAGVMVERNISPLQALKIANENGGQEFVEENELVDYYLKMIYSQHDNSWDVELNPDKTSPCLEMTIDAFTGKVINIINE